MICFRSVYFVSCALWKRNNNKLRDKALKFYLIFVYLFFLLRCWGKKKYFSDQNDDKILGRSCRGKHLPPFPPLHVAIQCDFLWNFKKFLIKKRSINGNGSKVNDYFEFYGFCAIFFAANFSRKLYICTFCKLQNCFFVRLKHLNSIWKIANAIVFSF